LLSPTTTQLTRPQNQQCGASGYLSFFFTDCLMSRWLLHYTPQATIVRLLTVDAINGYLTSWVLHLTGGFEDQRLILPAWIVISTVRTSVPSYNHFALPSVLRRSKANLICSKHRH
jgi:hypothetical protein